MQLDVPSAPARAALLVLHVARHGVAGDWAIEDLRRAADIVSPAEWQRAASLADELARGPFSSGLRLVPAGRAIADALGLSTPEDPVVLLHGRSAPSASFRMLDYAEHSAFGGFARMVAGELTPSSEQMRAWYPVARRGRRGLLAAYLVRIGRTHEPVAPGQWRHARAAAARH